MSDPDSRPISDEELEAIRKALARPEMEELLARLPPEIRSVVQQARVAMRADDPRQAMRDLAERLQNGPTPPRPEVFRAMMGSVLADAIDEVRGYGDIADLADKAAATLDKATEPMSDVEVSAMEAELGVETARAFADAVQRLHDLDLQGAFGPVLGDIGALQAELDALPARLGKLSVPPDRAQAHIGALRERAETLEAHARDLAGEPLLDELEATVRALVAVLEDAKTRSPQLALYAAALKARRGEVAAAREALRRALDAAEAQGAWEVGRRAGTLLQLDHLDRGDTDALVALSRRMVALADDAGSPRDAVQSRYDLGLTLARAGARVEGQELVTAALERARSLAIPDLVLRGVLVLGKILEAGGDLAGALRTYEGVLKQGHVPGTDQEVAQAAMGVVRCMGAEAVADPRRVAALEIVRTQARAVGDAETYSQASILLAESREATGDRPGAVRALLQGREALVASPRGSPAPLDRALQVFKEAWGEAAFQDALAKASR